MRKDDHHIPNWDFQSFLYCISSDQSRQSTKNSSGIHIVSSLTSDSSLHPNLRTMSRNKWHHHRYPLSDDMHCASLVAIEVFLQMFLLGVIDIHNSFRIILDEDILTAIRRVETKNLSDRRNILLIVRHLISIDEESSRWKYSSIEVHWIDAVFLHWRNTRQYRCLSREMLRIFRSMTIVQRRRRNKNTIVEFNVEMIVGIGQIDGTWGWGWSSRAIHLREVDECNLVEEMRKESSRIEHIATRIRRSVSLGWNRWA